jgi:hypothetical protein
MINVDPLAKQNVSRLCRLMCARSLTFRIAVIVFGAEPLLIDSRERERSPQKSPGDYGRS